METLLAFGAALLTLRLAGLVAGRWRTRRPAPGLLAWSAGLGAYALGTAALAWGAAAGWDERAFRAYYLFGGLLTAPLLGAGSLLATGRRAAGPAILVYSGLAVGIVLGVPIEGEIAGSDIPHAQDHLDLFPARVVAIAANVAGTIALVGVALATLRRRPLGNALLLAGFVLAAVGSAVSGLGVAGTSAFVAVAALLLYAGSSVRS
ncbi:MAG TPA: hypothetical protein VNT58_10390 [Gaiellaceae bacterium]|nr:hypothetical protein [Gaiellaceae bacterium]